MAIKVVTGVPGSGKTYYVLREVILKNYQWNKEFDEWELKEGVKPFTLFTNIDKLKLDHINLDAYLEEKGIDYKKFFTVEYQNKVVEKYGRVIIILDEAQRYFPADFKEDRSIGGGNNPEMSCFYFFEWHRHLGIDVYLIAQKWTRLHQNIVGLAEYQIDAVRRTLSLVGEFRYRFMNGFDVLSTKTIKPDKKIFALYQSMQQEDSGKQIKPLYKFLAVGVVLFVVAAFLLNMTIQHFAPPSAEASDSPPPSPSSISTPSEQPPARGDGGRGGARPRRGIALGDPVVSVRAGVMWSGPTIIRIQVLGSVYDPRDLPFSYVVKGNDVFVHVPKDLYLDSMQREDSQTVDQVKDQDINQRVSRYAQK